LGGEVKAQAPKDVNVVNEPNVNVLNNVDVNVTNDTTNPVPVVIQNGNNGQVEKELVEIVRLDVQNPRLGTGQLPPPIDVYTVPGGRRLVITDVIISGGSSGRHSIWRDGTIVSRVRIAPTGTGGVSPYDHSYVSGIEFQENQTVSIQPPPTSIGADFELRGYQTDMN
jgi:hypothetical protein